MAISTVSFNNTPQAADDSYTAAQTGLTEDSANTILLAVMANDSGGQAKTLYSLDDGIENEGSTTSADLLVKDMVGADNFSQFGALIEIRADGKVAYTMTAESRTHFDSLGAGETAYDSFTYAIRLGNGTLSWATATVEIRGVNDAAQISGNTSGAVAEDAAPNTATATGNLSASDVDNADNVFQASSGDSANGYGSFAVDAAGNWTYTLDNGNPAVDALNVGDSLSDSFTVLSEDGTAQLVSITINGSNDAAIISGNTSGAVAEDDAANTASGTLSASDVDNADNVFQASSGDGANGYGSFAVDTAGNWTYTLDNGNPDVDALNVGDSLSDSFTVLSDDGTAQLISITIDGSNDAAVLSADIANLSETDDAADISTSGQLTISDVDSPESFQAQTDTVGSYGKFSIDSLGAWSYVADSAHNEFVDGTTYTDTFSVFSADGTATSVTINIEGTNDAAVLSADIANLDETNDAADISTSGQLTISDVDSPATFQAQTDTAGSYGKFSIDSLGAWSYVADSAHNEFVDGVTYTDTFSVLSADGTETSVTINIEGTNDAAIISGVSTGSVQEDTNTVGGQLTTGGLLTISDADAGQSSFQAQPTVAGTYGTFTLATTGNWTYSVSNSLAVIQALNNGQSLVDSFTAVALDGSSSQLVQVTINGLTDTTPLTGTNSNNTFSFSAAASGIYTITDPGGNNDAIQITETNTELTSLNFAKVGNDLLIEFNDQQVTVLGQYAAGGANTIESITFSSGQTFHNFTLSGTYVLVTTQTPGNANTNWVLAGTSGDDSLQGGNNTNQHDLVFGNDLDDALTGRLGGDLLVGGAGNDSLNSGAGNDTLIGGTGNDTLTGSTGADTFVFGETGAPNLDTVLDYSFADGDKLDLSALLDSNFGGGSQVSDFVQLVQTGSNITVQVDADGTVNGAAFTDIAVLSNIGTAGLDQVRAWFGDTDHTLAV